VFLLSHPRKSMARLKKVNTALFALRIIHQNNPHPRFIFASAAAGAVIQTQWFCSKLCVPAAWCKNKFGQWSRTIRVMCCWLCVCQQRRAFQILFCKFSVPNGAVWFYACLVILQLQMSPSSLSQTHKRDEKQPVQWRLLFRTSFLYFLQCVFRCVAPASTQATNTTHSRARTVLKVFRQLLSPQRSSYPQLKLINGSLSHWNQSWGREKWN
jgi:hypothetical protein